MMNGAETEDMYNELNDKISYDFDKLVTDAKIISRVSGYLNKAENNQEEIEELIEEVLDLGNSLLFQVDDLRDPQFIEHYKRIYQENKMLESHPYKSLSTKTPSIKIN